MLHCKKDDISSKEKNGIKQYIFMNGEIDILS